MPESDPISLPPEGTVPPLADPAEFRDKLALVTGGTDGLGKHLCRTLIDLGAEVVFCARGEQAGNALAEQWGDRAHFIRTDLAEMDQAVELIQRAGQIRGHIDFLVNNAAIDPPISFEKTTLEQLEQVINIDLKSQYVICQKALPLLEAGTGKAIVNVGTTNYLFGWPSMTAYNAAKTGIVGFSRSLARELGPRGIRVNVVAPGWIMTPRQLEEKVSQGAMRDLLHKQAVKTLMTEQHVTPVTLFLLSRAAAGLSGQQIVLDGGYFLY